MHHRGSRFYFPKAYHGGFSYAMVFSTMMSQNFSSLFKGSWRFERHVKGLFPQRLAFEGLASFAQQAALRLYEESGSYKLNNQPMDFSTSFLYEILSETHCRILFSDQRLFYELTKPQETLEHLCGQDHYEGYFERLSADQWILNWRIKGPRKKNIEIMSCYFRL